MKRLNTAMQPCLQKGKSSADALKKAIPEAFPKAYNRCLLVNIRRAKILDIHEK